MFDELFSKFCFGNDMRIPTNNYVTMSDRGAIMGYYCERAYKFRFTFKRDCIFKKQLFIGKYLCEDIFYMKFIFKLKQCNFLFM